MSGEITGGSVTYGRTVQPAQYESKKAEVTLTFGIEQETPAETRDAFIVSVGNMAIHQVNRMVGLNEAPAVYEPPAEEPKRTRRTKAQIEADEVGRAALPSLEVTENPFGGGSSEASGTGNLPATEGAGFGEQTAGPTVPAASGGAAARDFAFSASGEAAEIPDIDLMSTLNKKAAELGGAKEINDLLSHYVPKGGNPRLVEQAKRQEFLEKVHALKAN